MKKAVRLPELKEIVGALLFAAKHPLTAGQMRRAVIDAAVQPGAGPAAGFAEVSEKDVRAALADLSAGLRASGCGLMLAEVAHGFRLVNDEACGLWIRRFLNRGKGSRLSKPALETLAIVAYRQPCTRSEIEAVRGVQVDQIMRSLLEMQLVRIVGRSELPGRALLYGTTQTFLEYFGIRTLEEMPGIDELRRVRNEVDGRAREKAKNDPDPRPPKGDGGEETEGVRDGQGAAANEEEN